MIKPYDYELEVFPSAQALSLSLKDLNSLKRLNRDEFLPTLYLYALTESVDPATWMRSRHDELRHVPARLLLGDERSYNTLVAYVDARRPDHLGS